MRFCPKGQKGWERAGLVLALSLLLSFPLYNWWSDHVLHVIGRSMLPTIQDGAFLFAPWNKEAPDRGDIVIVEVDEAYGTTRQWMKRVIGLPGDTIQIEAGAAHILLNGEQLDEPYLDPSLVTYDESGTWVVPDGEMFVMGDNRGNSTDSRYVGTFKLERIKVILGMYFQFGYLVAGIVLWIGACVVGGLVDWCWARFVAKPESPRWKEVAHSRRRW